jgi:hypothetical protein
MSNGPSFKLEVFDPEEGHSSVLEAFQEFVSQFAYSYDAMNREPPSSIKEFDEIAAWRGQDRRKVFLGRFAHRNLQKLYEELSTPDAREGMTFENMVNLLTNRFKANTNLSLANFNFRKLKQEEKESFEAFTIRVKREANNCDFKCTAARCTVSDTMVRDQILFGTRDAEIRKNALKEQWQLADLLTNGRAIEASDIGAATIKQEPLNDEIRRTKPGRYSRKHKSNQKNTSRYGQNQNDYNPKSKCKKCSSTRCEGGKQCPASKGSCFTCGKSGHFRGAELCKQKSTRRRSRRVGEGDSSSDNPSSDEETQSSESDLPASSSDDNSAETTSKTSRVYSRIPTIRRIGGRRHKALRKVTSKYNVDVVIKETSVPAFCDTGADICIMSRKNAKRIGLKMLPTTMSVRPYGSRAMKCLGETTCTVKHHDSVSNTKFYVMNKEVETLLSGPVCEELGIITFSEEPTNNIRMTTNIDEAKAKLMKKFPSIFSGVGTLKGHKVKFFIDREVPPVFQPPRPIPFHLREKMKTELRKMEESDIIEPHEGPAPWVSNVVLTPKDDGGTRVTIDMRCANKAIKRTNLPIPRPEEISSQLSGYTRFSKLDFASAFHQLEIDEGSRLLTVFHGDGRLMRYKRLTMGTTPASGELNKALRPIFQDIEHAHVIQDDLIVAGTTQANHDDTIDKVCQRISEIGMTLNPEKCIISADSIPWWGMEISKDGVSPDQRKVEAVKLMTCPRSREEVKSLYCMLQSNKDFIPSLANKTKNIRVLLRKESKFVWSKACQVEFDNIKKEFSNEILLKHFNPNLRTEIQVDAHQSGLSALLVQEEDGVKQIVGVASRATTQVETRYPQIDLEALAVDFGLRRFRFYIAGGPKISVITDHKPLISIFKNLRKGSIRTERIKLRHQDINYEVKWEKGINNPADYLSRHAVPLEKMPKEIREETVELEKTIWYLQFSPYTEAIDIEKLVTATDQDRILVALRTAIRRGYSSGTDKSLAPYAKIWDQLTISDCGLILKGEKIILPEALIDRAIQKAHQGGHPGMTAMKRRLRAHFWCPLLNARIEEMVKSCKTCAMFTPKNKKNHLQPHKLNTFNAWEKISVDLFGPMPDQRYIIVAQDMVSRFPMAKVITKTDAPHVTDALGEFYNTYGTPLIHRTDNGPPFNSHEFDEFSKANGIHHEKSFPYHPQSNPVEALMKPIGKTMKAAYASKSDKEKALSEFLSSYRATPHSSTGIAPGDIIFRHGYGSAFPRKTPPTDKEIQEALDFDQDIRCHRDEDLNITRREEEYAIGDKILTKNNNRTKFQPMFGPEERTITDVENGGVECIDKYGTVQRRHMDHIKPAPVTADTTVQNESIRGPPLTVAPPDNAEVEQQEEREHRRPVRTKKTNPRYKDYHLY